jgi:hypothetical protein
MKTLIFAPLLALAVLLPAGGGEAQATGDVSVQVDKDRIDFLVGKEVVTSYQIKKDWPRPFLWPLNTIGRLRTTRNYPMTKDTPDEDIDHNHHRSAWFAYGDIVPEGMDLKSKSKGIEGIDFWTENKTTGKTICVKVDPPKKTADGVSVTTHNEWLSKDNEKVLDETRTLHFYGLGKAYLVVFDIDLEASVYPLKFADTKEGAMAIRIRSDFDVMSDKGKIGTGKIQNAEGLVNAPKKELAWGLRSNWCDYSGKADDAVFGVTLMDDPANPRRAFWHARNYGLMAANPFAGPKSGFPAAKTAKDLIHLAKGEHLRLRYGILVHSGDAVDGHVEEQFQRFVKLRETEKR